MILRLILHVEWHPGYRFPRISIKRAPYPGQKVYDEGWGWRRLVMCGPCSGVGYFDAPLNDDRTVLWPRSIDENRAADEPLRASETGAVEWPGLHDADETLGAQEPSQGQHGPVYTEQTYRQMAVEDGLIPGVDNRF